jgi:very-short-patch-repair endonuclease
VGQRWTDLPVGRAIRLTGTSPAALALMLDPLPDDAPAVVTYRPADAFSVAAVVGEALDELEQAAIRLFPVWLPGADGVTGPAGAGVAAVRALARSMAPASAHYGPFLADLAERALRRQTAQRRQTPQRRQVPQHGRFSSEVRAAGLAKVVASAYDRTSAALVVVAPGALSAVASEVLVGACEWLGEHARLGVWLIGAQPPAADRLMPYRITVPGHIIKLEREVVETIEEPEFPTLSIPAVAGLPAGGSITEQALEQALAQHPWAAGRAWHQRYQPTQLDLLRFLDVLWEQEKIVVEVDGPEHRACLKWADDRLRDNQLQRDGYIVLRFPNERIATDMASVLHDIHTHLQRRRSTAPEGHPYAQR